MKFKFLLCTLIFTAAALVASADNGNYADPGTGVDEIKEKSIAGGVTSMDNKKPLNNVNVTAYTNSKKEKSVVTDVNGNYLFTDLKPGTYKLVFEKNGYRKVTRDKVVIRGDEGCQLSIEMQEEEDFQLMPGQFFD
jgi:Carboxypeptidase regulatory-like domain